MTGNTGGALGWRFFGSGQFAALVRMGLESGAATLGGRSYAPREAKRIGALIRGMCVV